MELVFVRGTWEKRTAGVHLRHNTPCAPDVNRGIVSSRAEKDIWCAIPQGHDFIGEGVNRDAECSGETKIGKLEYTLRVYEQVLRLQISVQHPVVMTECDTAEELVHETPDGGWF